MSFSLLRRIYPHTLLIEALLLSSFAAPALAEAPGLRSRTVPQCTDVHLQAAYLAEEKPGQGPGFLLMVQNDRDVPISLADPTPLSVDWYALQAGGNWLWRASSGSGGSLVNALRSKGPLFALESSTATGTHSIEAHSTYRQAVFSADSPVLRYRPGCEHCKYAGEVQYRAVLAYAFLPPGGAHTPELLRCGLRSAPVVMPRLEDSPKK